MEEIIKAFELESFCETKDKFYIITRFNWDYANCLKFQKETQRFIQKNRDTKVYIFTSHPHVFTMGRGNERGQENLIDFDEALKLPFPLHHIHRGGGITFHYPGQWIFYPIVSINQKYTLNDHIHWLLTSVRDELKETFGLTGLLATNKLVGVWKERQKLASIGVGVERFVTEHGLALNLLNDEQMFSKLNAINPCGMNPSTYRTVESFLENPAEELRDTFHMNFFKNQLTPHLMKALV